MRSDKWKKTSLWLWSFCEFRWRQMLVSPHYVTVKQSVILNVCWTVYDAGKDTIKHLCERFDLYFLFFLFEGVIITNEIVDKTWVSSCRENPIPRENIPKHMLHRSKTQIAVSPLIGRVLIINHISIHFKVRYVHINSGYRIDLDILFISLQPTLNRRR